MNFRNYEKLKLALEPGVALVEGGNGHGKSNLLEAVYLLAIAKSPRASSDRELVRRQALGDQVQAQVAATAVRDGSRVKVQIDLVGTPSTSDGSPEASDSSGTLDKPLPGRLDVQKQLRVNGLQRRSFEAVGEINAVLFTAQDIDLVLGSPFVRRRYMDILISQLDRAYLRALQRYQRVLSQRNPLLRSVSSGHARPDELDYWDNELVDAGGVLLSRRAATLELLSRTAAPIYRTLGGDDGDLGIVYRPSVQVEPGMTESDAGPLLRESLESNRDRELAQGFTLFGPHRDDLQMSLADMDVASYASRGQCRTVVLAMKLAEAAYLKDRRGDEPVVLLDDVLSELDSRRRAEVLDMTSQYEQVFITATDAETIGEPHISSMSRFVVRGGELESLPVAGASG